MAGGDAAAAPPVRTLIVDDSAAVRTGLSRLLQSRPFCEIVGAVGEPEAALEVTRTMRPHVVLQDFSMPGHDAIALVRELSACRPRPTVLMLSAFSDKPSAHRAIEAGAVGWVLKDAEPEQIFGALLEAAGVRHADDDASRGVPAAVAPPPPARDTDVEVPTSLDARTLWALLRALQSEPAGLTVDELATRAVIPAAIAARYLRRLSARQPALVGPRPSGCYAMTGAGALELARLERRNPAAGSHAHGTPPL